MNLVTITLTAPAKIGGQRYREGDSVDVSPGLAAQLRRDGLVRGGLIGALEDMAREEADRSRVVELEAEVADLKRQLAEARGEAPPAQPPAEPDPDLGVSLDDPTKRPRTKA